MQMDGAVSRTDLTDASFVPSDVGCVAIDEGQFYEGIEEFVRVLCKAGKIKQVRTKCARFDLYVLTQS